MQVFILNRNALTIDVTGGGGGAGQVQDAPVAAVDVFDGSVTQRHVHVEAKEHSDEQQSNDPGQSAAEVQPS